ncbi:ATP-binding cassette domain-containing protein [Poseidonocella sp. HB161398]|uniref:ATP-binding cassette domain-containing protein n=1 Tax=Poseidonocella sp. HB161398 TaxID=2320855 RepID=UPI001107B076|nr:ATP-binding cassette domain-containing protein [Poseidonocella sp. HB161398]
MDAALTFDGLTLGYGRRTVIDGLSVSLPRGRFTALIGPNGCGKSTILKALTRVLPVAAGRVSVEGTRLQDLSARDLARRISMLPQSLAAPDGVTVRQLASYGRSPHSNIWGALRGGDRDIVEAALRRLGVAELGGQPVAALSGGQQQRAWLAMVLAQRTPIVLLDEPTTYLDIAHQVEVLELCRELAAEGRTVVAVLHDLNQAFRYADHVVVLREGGLVASGAPAAVADSATLRRAFDIDARILADPEAGTPMMVIRETAERAGRSVSAPLPCLVTGR